MSFTTRCPACGTVFRVVADQLKISDGWVRCGHCSDVFDATIHLQAWVPSARPSTPPREAPAPAAVEAEPVSAEVLPVNAPPAVEPQVAVAPAAHAPMASAPAAPTTDDVPADDDLRAWFGDGPLDAAPAATPEPADLPLPAAPVEAPIAPPPAEADVAPPDALQAAPEDEDRTAEFQAELARFAQTVRSAAPVATLSSSAREDVPADAGGEPEAVRDEGLRAGASTKAEVVEPGFMRQARRRAFWTAPGVRIGLGALALVLAALLLGQWLIHERHQVVASYPQARPWIERACGWLGCDLAPTRRIEAVEIESAELVRRLGNFYAFDFVLRNRSALEVALPALELTLTSLGEQPMARRVFLPQDWPDAPPALAPNSSVAVSLRLSLMLGDDASTAGYRALVFYP
jgi:predicted Zn finger-like uncharacterized protein